MLRGGMPLTSREHEAVQREVDNADQQQRTELKVDAELVLSNANTFSQSRKLLAHERKAFEMAVEVLVRLEATEKNKGWWFRAKRRLQLVQMYLGG